MANPSPQHNPTDGLGTATNIVLTGTGITQVAGNVYKVSLNVGASPNPASVAVTSTIKDVGNNTFSSGNSNTAALKSYDTSVASVSGSTVTAVKAGQVVVESQFATFDTTDGVDKVYAQLLVQVAP
jgi:hypothetical protein